MNNNVSVVPGGNQIGTSGGTWTVDGSGNLVASVAVSQIVPGATSFAIRNHANSASNLIVLDAGQVGIGLSPTKPLHVVDSILLSPSASVGANSRGVAVGGANNGTTQFSWRVSANEYVNQEFDITPSADGTTNPPVYSTPLVRLLATGGMQLGSPTGGDKGAATLNTAGLTYLNGTLQSAVQSYVRPTTQTNTTVTLATFTPAADGTFEVSANVNVTTSTTITMTVTCTYHDETNTARTLTLPFALLAGTQVQSITTAQGNVPYHGVPLRIRAKAATAITIQTAGTVTACVYTADGSIVQVA